MYLRFHIHGRCVPRLRGTTLAIHGKLRARKEWLDTWAVHYQTGEKIPQEYIDKIKKSSNFQAGYASDRQLSFGMVDMAWHTITEPVTEPLADFEQRAMGKTEIMPLVKGSAFSPLSDTSLPGDTLPDTMVTNGQKFWMPMPSLYSNKTVFSTKLPPNRSAATCWKRGIRKPNDSLQALPGPRADG